MPRKPAPKKTPAQKRAAKRSVPRKSPVPLPSMAATPEPEDRPSRDPAREIPAEDQFQMPELPPPADYLQVLVALTELDPLAQEVMIAQRLAAMPSQRDGGMPVNIPRMVRGPWAHNLRKLGIFCIPELATHELVAPDGSGILINHTAMTTRKIDESDLWKMAKNANPELAALVDNAETPEDKRAAMNVLVAKMPVEHRIMVDRLMATRAEELEPK